MVSLETHAFTPLAPSRLLDTRNGVRPGPGTTVDVTVVGVPGDAAIAVLNLTAVNTAGAGYITAFAKGATRPVTSHLNVDKVGQTRANQVTVAIGTDRMVSLFTDAGTHFVVDLAGYYAPAQTSSSGRFITLRPSRVLDTRRTATKPAALSTTVLPIVGVGGVPANATAVTVNITATAADGSGFVIAFPGGARPQASTINLDDVGQTRANLATIPVAADGTVSLFTQPSTHLIVDLLGFYTGSDAPNVRAGLFAPLAERLLDTRTAARTIAGADTLLPLGAASGAALRL